MLAKSNAINPDKCTNMCIPGRQKVTCFSRTDQTYTGSRNRTPLLPPVIPLVLNYKVGFQDLENCRGALQQTSQKRGRSEHERTADSMGRLPSAQSVQDEETQSQE